MCFIYYTFFFKNCNTKLLLAGLWLIAGEWESYWIILLMTYDFVFIVLDNYSILETFFSFIYPPISIFTFFFCYYCLLGPKGEPIGDIGDGLYKGEIGGESRKDYSPMIEMLLFENFLSLNGFYFNCDLWNIGES